MKITLLCTGKTDSKYLAEGITVYEKRLAKYADFTIKYIMDVKNASKLPVAQLKQNEGDRILEMIKPTDWVVLLDERGDETSSVAFAKQIEQCMLRSVKHLIFVIGGAYGFSDAVYARANIKISLSKMTFSHLMVRLIFLEQLYRAFTILNGEPYHHE